ncbi:DUF5676 family membrane protein [Hyphomonas sp.]|uniref:DUF5676 family membrane protein n=1 Tax=Hyphomonas sp. TaxID=87 RepID=UPI003D272ECD
MIQEQETSGDSNRSDLSRCAAAIPLVYTPMGYYIDCDTEHFGADLAQGQIAPLLHTRFTMKIIPTGQALSLFLALTFIICIGWGLMTPMSMHMHEAWTPLLPGFEFLTWPGFLIGLVEAYAYGWYVALIFVPLYRFFNGRTEARSKAS